MKSLLLILLIFGITLPVNSQSESSKSETNATIVQNLKYLNKVKSENNPVIITKLENLAAHYDIKASDVYNSKSNVTYDVVFEETNAKILVTYNKEGEIVNSLEEYKNLRLPMQVSSAISKNYPGWSFASNEHQVIYNNGELKKSYTVKIKNNSASKVLKFESDNSNQSNYIAVNKY